ncbi:T6SS phospholipase effector Tle1-like catalytic domain-containing protein [Frateuria defendens]|uniref:T6SS phospholipase effector Tle1-like catalytic domain-containing protein n=1 Tax=Frateuria defendens TaxID=2219559 RepID=UPI00066FCEAB|nr:DUF2235 domain-containing protein [Frateuria defendens]
MPNETRVSADGVPSDGVGHALATPAQLAQFEGNEALARFRVPILVRAGHPHEKLFVAAFDGTGNNKYTDPGHATNVAWIDDQIKAANQAGNTQIHSYYVPGPGAQADKLVAAWDLARGFSYEENLNTAYQELVNQADAWKQADPDAVIRVHSLGFSRGGSQSAGFSRLVHEQGIPDLRSRTFDAAGRVAYARYHVPPGQVVQAVGLFDPVATGVPMDYDRRLPPSVVSGLQITAADERRATFPSDQILPPGLSEDGRFLNLTVPGAHSDVGGGYLRNGLAIRCGNLMIDYCNALRDEPFLPKRHEPTDPRLNVIHRSEESLPVYRLDPREGVRGEPSGTNRQLAPAAAEAAGPVPHAPEAVDPALMRPLTFRPMARGPVSREPAHPAYPPASPEAIAEAGRSVPFAPTVARTLGTAALLGDAVQTGTKTVDLMRHGNDAGSQSEVLHFAGRNLAGWAGAGTFAAIGSTLGLQTGPGLIVTGAIGGAAGLFAGDKLADAYDHHRVYNQDDPQGRTWHYDPAQPQRGWTREIPPLPDAPHGQHLVADAALASRLSYQASTTAVELALAREVVPRDPYAQPAAADDAPSRREAPWIRDPGSHHWTRQVTDRVLEHGLASTHTEIAGPGRAAQLDRAAEQTLRENVANSPAGMARRYQAAYAQEGWSRHGPMPEAVSHALHAPANRVAASDGHTYTQAADGQWSRPDRLFGTSPAEGRVREELDASERLAAAERPLPAGPALARQAAAAAPATPTPPGRLDDPAHPDHALFRQAREHIVQLDRQLGRTPDQYTDNLASALAVQARADGLQRVDQIALSDDGSRLWAVQTPPGRQDHLFDRRTSVPTAAANTPMEQSAAQWPQAMQQFQAQEQAQQVQAHTLANAQAPAMQSH